MMPCWRQGAAAVAARLPRIRVTPLSSVAMQPEAGYRRIADGRTLATPVAGKVDLSELFGHMCMLIDRCDETPGLRIVLI